MFDECIVYVRYDVTSIDLVREDAISHKDYSVNGEKDDSDMKFNGYDFVWEM